MNNKRRQHAIVLNGKGINIFGWVPPRTNDKGKLELHIPGANFEGPRTDIKRRLSEGINGTTKTDEAAKKHDIEYYNVGVRLRNGDITKAQAEKLIRESDKKLVSQSLKNKLSINPLENLHASVAATGIIAKIAGEELGLTDPLMFVNIEKTSNEKETELKGGSKKKKQDLIKNLRKRIQGKRSSLRE